MSRPSSSSSVVIPIDSAAIAAIESCINRELLRCETLLQAATAERRYEVALIHAENAYTVATECHLPAMQAKANFYKAQCFKKLGLRYLAHDCRNKAAEELQRNTDSLSRECIAEMEAFQKVEVGDRGNAGDDRAADEDIDWIAAGEANGSSQEKHLVRDEKGRIIEILSEKPSLRSMKGRDFVIPNSMV